MTRLRVAAAAGLLLFMGGYVLEHVGLLEQSLATARRGHRHPSPAGQRDRRPSPHRRITPGQPAPRLGRVLFAPSFSARNRLVTNDFAYFNPDSPDAVTSKDWIVTSGSLFAADGAGWTGRPDSRRPNARSSNGTGSATFRLVTRRRSFRNVAVIFDLRTQRLLAAAGNPAHSWDGVHLFLRYQSQHSLYVLSINRRDGIVAVKKKRPGGSANGGTYYTLGPPATYRPPLGRWQHIMATIRTNADGTVTIGAYAEGRLILMATDAGIGGAPLDQPGAIGIRGDNTEFRFAHLDVRAIG